MTGSFGKCSQKKRISVSMLYIPPGAWQSTNSFNISSLMTRGCILVAERSQLGSRGGKDVVERILGDGTLGMKTRT